MNNAMSFLLSRRKSIQVLYCILYQIFRIKGLIICIQTMKKAALVSIISAVAPPLTGIKVGQESKRNT